MNRLATVIALCGLALGGALSTHRGPDQEDPSAVAFGIVTAVAGAPFFLWILLRKRGAVDL